jgi:hypothetical protein
LRTFVEHRPAERVQVLEAGCQGDEVIAGQLAHLAGKMHPAIGQQNFGLADAAGIKDHMARRRIAGVVLIADAKVQLAERHPDSLAAPAHMDKFAVERHGLAERRTSFGR